MDAETEEEFQKRCKKPLAVFLCKICKKYFQGTDTFLEHKKSCQKKQKEIEVIVIDDDEDEDPAPISDASNSLHRFRPGPKSKKNLLRIPDGEENQESHIAVSQKAADLTKKPYCRPGPKCKKKQLVPSHQETDGNKGEDKLKCIQETVDADVGKVLNVSNEEVAPTPNEGDEAKQTDAEEQNLRSSVTAVEKVKKFIQEPVDADVGKVSNAFDDEVSPTPDEGNEAKQKDIEEQNIRSSVGTSEKVKKCIQEAVDADVGLVSNASDVEVAPTPNQGDEAKQKDVEDQNLRSSVSAVERVKKQAKYRPGPKCKKKILIISTEKDRINDGICQSAHSDVTDKNENIQETALQDPSTRAEKGESGQTHFDSGSELLQDSSKCVAYKAGGSFTKTKYRPGPKSKKKLIHVPRVLEDSYDELDHGSAVTQNSSVEAQIIFVTDSSEDLMEESIEGNGNSSIQSENEEVHVNVDEMTVELTYKSPDLRSTNKLVHSLSERNEISDFSEQETEWQISSDTIAQVQTTVLQTLTVLGAKNPSDSNVIQDSTISSGECHRNQSTPLNLATVNPDISTDTNPNVTVSEFALAFDGVISTKARIPNSHLRNTTTILSGNSDVSFSKNLPLSGPKVLDNENPNLVSQDQTATVNLVDTHKNVSQSDPEPSLDEEDELNLVRKELLLLLEGAPLQSDQAGLSGVTDSSTFSQQVAQNKLSTSANNTSSSVQTSVSPETVVTSDSGLSSANSENSFTSSVLSSNLTAPTGVETSTEASSMVEVPKSVPVIKRGRGRPRKNNSQVVAAKTINNSSGIANGTPRAIIGHIKNISNKRKGKKLRKPGRPKKSGAKICKKPDKPLALKSGRGPGRPRKSDSPSKPNPSPSRVPPEDKTNTSDISSETEQAQPGNNHFASSAVATASTTDSSTSSDHILEPVRTSTDSPEQAKESDVNRVPASLIPVVPENQNAQLALSQNSEKKDTSRILPISYSITNLGKIPRKQVPDSAYKGQQQHQRKRDSTDGTVTAQFGEVIGVAVARKDESSQSPRSPQHVTSRLAPKSGVLYDYRKPAPVSQNSTDKSTSKFTIPPPTGEISDCLSAANTVPSPVGVPPPEKTENRILRPSEPAKKTRITLEEYKKERYLNPQKVNVPPLKGILKKPAIAAANHSGPAMRTSGTARDTSQPKAISQVEEMAIPSIRSPDKPCAKLTRSSSQEMCRIIPDKVYLEPTEIPARKEAKLASAGDVLSRAARRSGPFMPYVNPSPPASPPPSEHGLFARKEQSAQPIKELDISSSNDFSPSEPPQITPIRQQPRIIPFNVSVPTPSPSNNSISSVTSNGSSSNEAAVSPPDIPSFRDMYFRPRKRRMSEKSYKDPLRDDALSIASDSSSDVPIIPGAGVLERPTRTCVSGLLKLPTTNVNQKNSNDQVFSSGKPKSTAVKPHISPRSEMGKVIAEGIHALEATKDVGADLDGLEGLLDLNILQSEVPTDTAEAVTALSDPRIRKRKELQQTSGLTPGRTPEQPASIRSPSPGAESNASSSWSASGSQRPSERSSLSAGRRESKESVNTQSSFSSSDNGNRPKQYTKASYRREYSRSRSIRRDSSESSERNHYRHKSRNRSRDRSYQKRSSSRSRHQRGKSSDRSYHPRSRSRSRSGCRKRDSRGRSGHRRSRSREDRRRDRSPSRSRCEKIRYRSRSDHRSRSR